MNNESMADRVLDGSAEEVHASNNGVPPTVGYKISATISRNGIISGAVGIALGYIIGQKLNARGLALKSAQKVQTVAEQAEEAATRG